MVLRYCDRAYGREGGLWERVRRLSSFGLFSLSLFSLHRVISLATWYHGPDSCPVSVSPHPQTGNLMPNLMLNLILMHFSSGLEQLSYAGRAASVNPIPKLISKSSSHPQQDDSIEGPLLRLPCRH